MFLVSVLVGETSFRFKGHWPIICRTSVGPCSMYKGLVSDGKMVEYIGHTSKEYNFEDIFQKKVTALKLSGYVRAVAQDSC